jgi:hypothetical protein
MAVVGWGVGTVSIQRIGLGGMAVPCRGASLIQYCRRGEELELVEGQSVSPR